MELSDTVVVIIGGMSIVATTLLSIIGISIAQQTSRLHHTVEELQSYIHMEKKRMFGLRASAATLGSFVGDTHSAIDLLRRATENLLLHVSDDGARHCEVFCASINKPLERLTRLEHYLRLIEPKSELKFEERIALLCARFPDFWTVHALEELTFLLPPEEAEVAAKAVRALRIRLEGYDARRWTG